MSKIQPGRRVRLRGSVIKGQIHHDIDGGSVYVKWDRCFFPISPSYTQKKECLILLKPRSKPEARVGREIWLPRDLSDCHPDELNTWEGLQRVPDEDVKSECILFREVKPGHISVSRADLAKAWDSNIGTRHGSDGLDFDVFLKSLGFNPSETA